MRPLLEVRDLHLHFDSYWGEVHALNGIDLTLRPGEITGIVGETGSGKSVLARTILRLLEKNAVLGRGEIMFDGADLLKKSEREMRRIRGKEIAMVFQDARATLNPAFTVGHQLEKVVTVHQGVSRRAARARALDLLRDVEISEPERRARQYPHELSGGMCQRVMIAMALICSPKLILLDEPTTGLDVSVQAEILTLIGRLVRETGTGALLITHDLGVVMEVCDSVGVMYAGQIVEFGTTEELFTHPRHPYTAALQDASLGVDREAGQSIAAIPGYVPDLRFLPAGCYFASRCAFRSELCEQPPPVREISAGHTTRCFHPDKLAEQREGIGSPGQ